jgi:hypothetical protein
MALLITSLVLASCGSPAGDEISEEPSVAASQTAQAALAMTSQAEPTEAEPTATTAPTATVEHLIFPDEPAGNSGELTDISSAAYAEEQRALADSFVSNLLERPFTAEEMVYRPDLDITGADISKNGDFIYVSIWLEGLPAPDSQAAYGVELDLDRDGRGDWLIWAAVPAGSDWTTDGVQACRDADEDVGAETPMRNDSPGADSTGYEDCVFDSGQGISPDEAWVRQAPVGSSQVQIAFLYSLIDEAPQFLWGVWADADEKDPGRFDYQDQMSLEEAGSADQANDNYPLKELALMDNSCRWAYGFSPSGSEAGICTLPPTPVPTEGCVKGSPPSTGGGWYWDQGACAWIVIN